MKINFRLLVFRTVHQRKKADGCKYFYEKLIPYLTSHPLLSCFRVDDADFRSVPLAGDVSFIHCALEALRHLGRTSGFNRHYSNHLPSLVKWNCLSVVNSDLQRTTSVYSSEIELVRSAIRIAGVAVAFQAETGDSTFTTAQLKSVNALFTDIDIKLKELDPCRLEKTNPPLYELTSNEKVASSCTDWWLYGRFRKDFDVELLAGEAVLPRILRPVELTLIPDRVTDFMGVTTTLRHAVNLCTLLANQQDQIRNSYTIRITLIQHIFIRVIPLPLTPTNPNREASCFWHAQPMRYETQAEIMRLMNLICRHFAAASLSVKVTRSGDATRMLTFACMACISDTVLRKIACDIPSESSLHYAGKAAGPIQPFGFKIDRFAEESEYLKFSTPEAASARTQVLDYFLYLDHAVSEDHFMFAFEDGNKCGRGERRFIQQLCLQMGFNTSDLDAYISGENRALFDLYPEIAFFRDLVFMFKLVMVPTSDALPELKPWSPEAAVLSWKIKDREYIVNGFDRKLECTLPDQAVEEQQQKFVEKPKSAFSAIMRYLGLGKSLPRASPSQANPSILIGQRVDTEDDILHIKNLPDFDNSLGAKDVELMLSYLLAPYMRIPLLLNFFSSEGRLKALRTRELQEVLDAALFEPGRWQEEFVKVNPQMVPAENRDNLSTPTGLLFNEIQTSPDIVLASVKTMLERVVEMDTGRCSELGSSILYVVRLAVRVEGYIGFLVKNCQFHSKTQADHQLSGAFTEAHVRGLESTHEIFAAAIEHQKTIRAFLEDRVFKIIARWINVAKKEGKLALACMLHAHLAFIFRNMEEEDLNAKKVFTVLASQIFLFNNYKYDLDLDFKDKETKRDRKVPEQFKDDLGIPQVELFDMYQRNRRMIVNWLCSDNEGRNSVSYFFK